MAAKGSSPSRTAGLSPNGAEEEGAPRLTQTEQKLSNDIMHERLERFAAINEIWEKIFAIEKSSTREGMNSYRNNAPEPARVQEKDVTRENSETIAALQSTVQGETGKLWRTVESMREAGRALEERLVKLDAEVRRSAGVTSAALSRGGLDPMMGAPPFRQEVSSGGIDGKRLVKLEEMETQLMKQVKEQSALRQMVLESNLTLPLQAIGACRMALRASVLTTKQREEALTALDDKESNIRTKLKSVAVSKSEQPGSARGRSPSPRSNDFGLGNVLI